MGFLDVLFAKKNGGDKNWKQKLGRMLSKNKKAFGSYDALYLYYYYTEVTRGGGHYDYFAQNYKWAEKFETWNEIYKSLNNQLPSGLKENFNAAFEFFKDNWKKAEDSDSFSEKFVDKIDEFDLYVDEHIKDIEQILYEYYKKLINK